MDSDLLANLLTSFFGKFEERMDNKFKEVASAFESVRESMKQDREAARAAIHALETRQASAGKPSWPAIIAGAAALVCIITPLCGWFSTATDNRVLQHEIEQLRGERELYCRIAVLESKG